MTAHPIPKNQPAATSAALTAKPTTAMDHPIAPEPPAAAPVAPNGAPHPRRSPANGFTIMELMVAITIAGIIMTLAGSIMIQSINAVTQGMAVSEVVNSSRVISEQIQRDASQMIGPGGLTPQSDPTGFAFHPGRGGVLIITNRTINAPIVMPNGDVVTGPVRSDGLYFIRQNRTETSMTPASNTQLGSNIRAPFLLISYGHAQRLGSAGLGQGDSANPDYLANRWIFARQALHLWEDDIPPEQERWTNSITARSTGTLDVVSFSLHNSLSVAGADDRLMVGDPETSPSAVLLAGAGNYEQTARALTFLNNPLQVQPNPDPTTLNANAIARQHPILMVGVSDFQVAYVTDRDSMAWIEAPSAAGNVRVFRHDDFENSDWPYMIRLRYRIHDQKSRLADGPETPGRQFEQIIRVVRPR